MMLFRHGNAMRILYFANHDNTVKASYAIYNRVYFIIVIVLIMI